MAAIHLRDSYPDSMRILYSCPLDPMRWAAAGTHVLGVVKALRCLGHFVTLLHVGPHMPQLGSVAQVAIAVDGDSLGRKLWRDIALSREILKACRSYSYDVLYHRFSKSSFLPIIAGKILGKPIVVEVNSDIRSEPDILQMNSLQRELLNLFERINYTLADHIIVVSEGIAESISRIYFVPSTKVSVVPNGADLDTFRPMSRVDCCRRLGLDEANRYVAFAGTFQPWQGLETLIQAAFYVRQAHPEIVFLIVGDGPERPKIERLINFTKASSFFQLTGWRSPEETALYLGASEVCIAPYTRQVAAAMESCKSRGALMRRSPLKIYTYLACGRPVVASHFADAGQLVESLGAGIAVPPERPDLLAQAILYLLDHPDEARAMGEAGRRAAETNYGWQCVAKRILEICDQVRNR